MTANSSLPHRRFDLFVQDFRLLREVDRVLHEHGIAGDPLSPISGTWTPFFDQGNLVLGLILEIPRDLRRGVPTEVLKGLFLAALDDQTSTKAAAAPVSQVEGGETWSL